MIARASLVRKASRGQLVREDYPGQRAEWLRWVLIRKGTKGEMELATEAIPIKEYSLHP